MARVTGTGCAVVAASAALTWFGLAGKYAAERANGPGGFAMHLLDRLTQFADFSNGDDI
jgi:hydroxyethylthiazole kinase